MPQVTHHCKKTTKQPMLGKAKSNILRDKYETDDMLKIHTNSTDTVMEY